MVGVMQAPNSREFEFLFVMDLVVPKPAETNCFSMLYRNRPPLAEPTRHTAKFRPPVPHRRGGYFCF